MGNCTVLNMHETVVFASFLLFAAEVLLLLTTLKPFLTIKCYICFSLLVSVFHLNGNPSATIGLFDVKFCVGVGILLTLGIF